MCVVKSTFAKLVHCNSYHLDGLYLTYFSHYAIFVVIVVVITLVVVITIINVRRGDAETQQVFSATVDLLSTVGSLLNRLDVMVKMMIMMIMMTPFCCSQVFVLPPSVSLKTGALCEVPFTNLLANWHLQKAAPRLVHCNVSSSYNHFSATLLPGARLAETDAEKSNPAGPQGAHCPVLKPVFLSDPGVPGVQSMGPVLSP